ncbi:hypothetical protein J4E83_006966 [Alternaria metachromatica]|uniref:uncharacterized protein n=1 Tax=Alternaria metachromatica TaxID=283354 RepID=UPI0020C58F07|nr:uncharacterized protein J4E83_006966 [Alternaria metachromatica]KAI4615239.1 hypothetical protein J4E83_006966 [Alternaria metachromatica]
MPSIRRTLIAALVAFPVAMGHSWIEQMRNINDKGEYVGQYGYPRGYVAKTDKGYNGDTSMNNLVPPLTEGAFISKKTLLCHPSQRKPVQSQEKYPRLQAPPGGFVALRYMENGHVTEPANPAHIPGKPPVEAGGTIWVYGTTEPKEDEKISTVMEWTKDGSGGDKRGKLLAVNNYNDGRCYEINNTPTYKERSKEFPAYAFGQAVEGQPGNFAQFCESNVQIPESAELGKPYTLYWTWQWNTRPGGVKEGGDDGLPKGKNEWYTTCMDVDVTSPDVALSADASPKFALVQQDAGTAAVSDFASRTAILTDLAKNEWDFPILTEISLPGSGSGSGSGSGGEAPFPTNSTSPAGPTAPITTSAVPVPSAAPPAPSSSLQISAIVPSATAQLPSPSNSAASSATMEIPTLSGRPGAAPTPPAGNDGVVTVTDTVIVTVTAPAPTAPVATPPAPPAVAPPAITPRAVHSIYHRNGAKFRGL